MRRLYLHIYLAFLGIVILFGVLVFVTWLIAPESDRDQRVLHGVGAILGDLLPDGQRPIGELEAAVERLGALLPAHFTLRRADGTLLASVGPPLPRPPSHWQAGGWMHAKDKRPIVALALPDGRWMMVHWWPRRRAYGVLMILGLLAVAIAVGAYPVARRITRRLERLPGRVDALGAGDLSTRVEVEGRDEVATLARSFNRAADRIERLVDAQRSILAGASHELRSPLARIRMAIELLPGEERPELRLRLSQDIAELDDLIGELLLASRLDAMDHLEHTEEVDLLALLAEEGLRVGAEVSGEPICILGDPRMLRRLMRNLLENARRYAGHTRIEASVSALASDSARLCVADRGPGVPLLECERVFEPFYRVFGHQDHNDSGVGLGLALVRQIARHHGGDARCAPREGGGTCFEVDLWTKRMGSSPT